MYNIIIYSIIFLLGISVGSFANVCIYRIPQKQSIISPPSHCPTCGVTIKKYDLIPVLSYMILKGKCRNCGERFSPQYAIIEAIFGLVFMLVYWQHGYTIMFLIYALLASLVMVIAVIDIKTMEVPDELIIFGLIVGVPIASYQIIIQNNTIISHILGFVVGGGLFLLIAVITNAMGGGDIKLMAVIGLWVGLPKVLLITLLSFVVGAVISIFLLVFKIKGRKDFIPFVPFIMIASLLTIIFGNEIIAYYIQRFFV